MPEIDIERVDTHLKVETELNLPDVRFYDVRRPPFAIYGLYNPLTEPQFKRLPDEVGRGGNDSMAAMYACTAGGRVRFATDSPYVAIKTKMPKICRFAHMPLTGSAGFDMYLDTPDGSESLYHLSFVPSTRMEDGYESVRYFYEPGMHYITINFPLYSEVSELYIGIAEGSKLTEGAPYRDLPPVVYYGSSVTQGGCASRPGNSYQAMVSRALAIDHVNLGFSNGGRGEDCIVDYMRQMKMSAFVSDYDHNAQSYDDLVKTHRRMYERFREVQPDVPYLILSRPDFYRILPIWGGNDQSVERRRVILETYHYARDCGDKNVYFLDGESLMRGPWSDSCTVDGGHPNDLGFAYMAMAITDVLRRILCEGKMKTW